MGIPDDVTAKDGVLVLFVTVGTNQDGQLADGAKKLVTVPVPLPEHQAGAAPTNPVPVSHKYF